ncbi:MAG: hypothetical protein JW755_12185 [Candidatus Aminicenantes bacterium]|nr:hypothetical protein [Candidatus Aminicenantes bacterium]
MKHFSGILTAVILTVSNAVYSFLPLQEDIVQSFREGDYLKVDASIKPGRLSRGEEGKLVLKFKLKEGIKLSSHPFFSIEVSPDEVLVFPKNFFAATDLDIQSEDNDGREFLNMDEDIEIPFTVTLDTEWGNHSLEGKIKYFAYSIEQKWFLKNTINFSASYYVRNRTIKR